MRCETQSVGHATDEVPEVSAGSQTAAPILPGETAACAALLAAADPERVYQRQLAREFEVLHEGIADLERCAGLPEIANRIPGWRRQVHSASHALGDPTSLAGTMSPFRLQVAFVGRTGSGKSTLINGLLRRAAATVGNGYQRTTRVPRSYQFTAGIDIIDTPGVAAAGGEDDEIMARAAARRADFLVYVLNDDQLGGQEASVLSQLDDVTAPCLLVLNVKLDIDGSEKKKDESNKRRRFLESPGWLYDRVELEEHAARVAEAAPRLWQRAGGRLHPVHALAAVMATQPRFEPDAERLEANSRIAGIQDELEAASRGWVPSFRVIEVTQPFRDGAAQAGNELEALANSLRGAGVQLQRVEQSTNERVDAILRSHQAAFRDRVALALHPVRADLPVIVEARGSRDLVRRWSSSLEEAQLEQRFRHALHQLAAEIGEVLASPVEVSEGIVWAPPVIRFEHDIDIAQIIVGALLDEMKGKGLKAIVRSLTRLLAKRGAQSTAAGGPAGFIAVALVWVLSTARRIQLGRRDAFRRQAVETTRYLRGILDGLESNLPGAFASHVQAGTLGMAVADHRQSLLRSKEAIVHVACSLAATRADVSELGHTWTSLQIDALQRLWGGRTDGWRLDWDMAAGAITVTGDPHVPWVAVSALERLTGVSVIVQAADEGESSAAVRALMSERAAS